MIYFICFWIGIIICIISPLVFIFSFFHIKERKNLILTFSLILICGLYMIITNTKSNCEKKYTRLIEKYESTLDRKIKNNENLYHEWVEIKNDFSTYKNLSSICNYEFDNILSDYDEEIKNLKKYITYRRK